MKFAASLTVTGIITFLLLEGLKMLMAPVTAWVMGMLAIALKMVLMVLGISLAVGASVFAVVWYRRSQTASAAD